MFVCVREKNRGGGREVLKKEIRGGGELIRIRMEINGSDCFVHVCKKQKWSMPSSEPCLPIP